MAGPAYGALSRRSAGLGFVALAVLMGVWIGAANRNSPAHDAVYVVLVFSAVCAVLTPLVFLTMRSQDASEVRWSRLPVFYGALAAWTITCCLVAWLTWSLS